MRDYISRDSLYPEEDLKEIGFSNQTCVMFKHKEKVEEVFATSRQGNLLLKQETLFKDVMLTRYKYIIFYVDSDKIALELAKRYINEHNDMEYKIVGIDKHFSVFD